MKCPAYLPKAPARTQLVALGQIWLFPSENLPSTSRDCKLYVSPL